MNYTVNSGILLYKPVFCDKCGGVLQIGSFPFCRGRASDHAPASTSVNGDEFDFIAENGFRHPQRFTSKRAYAKALADQGLEVKVRHVTIPGTDKSPHTTDWSKGSIDAVTLDNARILTERAGRATADRLEPAIPMSWTITAKDA